MGSVNIHPPRFPSIRVGSWVDKNTDFCVFQLSSEEVGFGSSGECKPQLFANIGFGEDLVFGLGFEADQSRHDICALDLDHESNFSLRVENESNMHKQDGFSGS